MITETKKDTQKIIIELENLNEAFIFYFMLKFSKIKKTALTKESSKMRKDLINIFEEVFSSIKITDFINNLKD